MMLTSVGTWAQGGEDPPAKGSGDSLTVSVSVSDTAALKSALESETASTINMTESITLTEEVKITVGADHILSIAEGKTLTCTVKYGIGFKAGSNISLTIQGEGAGSNLVINADNDGRAITNGTLTLNNITVDITSGIFDPTNLTVGSGATINVDAADQTYPLQSSVTVDNGGTININTFKGTGIHINTALTINSGGTVKVGNGTGDNRGVYIRANASIVLNGGTLEGTGEDKGGNIYLQQNAKVTGMSGKLVDQGNELSENGEVTVGAENAEPSTTSLTEGLYTWDKSSSKFAKPDLNEGWVLNSENGELTISSQTGMTNWRQNGRGSNYSKVKSVTITGNVTEIVDYAFSSCSNLTQVTITANEITGIGAAAFQRTTSLTMIEIPASVTTIGNAAFSGSGITSFTVAKDNSSFKTDADCKALLTNDGETLFAFAPKAIGSYTIPDGVVTIGPYSFESSTLNSLKILSSVKTIGESAFLQSSALTTVTFEGEKAPTIEAGIFAYCDNLAGIFVPANATGYTGDGASENWKAWAQYIKAGQPQTTGNNTVPADGTLIGDGTTTAEKVTPEGDATLENVKTQATEVGSSTTSEIILTGSNELGAITVGSGGSLTLLTANEGTRVTVTSVANSGTFTDNTGSVTKVTGEASLNLSAVDAMPSDQTATGQVTLTAKPAVAEGADVSYQWQKQENGTWTNVSNPYTRATVTGSPDFTTSISGRYRCQIKVEKNSVSTTLHTRPATATVKSTPDPEPEPTPTYYTVTLPSVEGAVTDPVAGSYDVESWSTFRFYLTLADDYNQSVPIVTTSRGEVIEPRPSDGAYLVNYVRTDVTLSIDGIVKNPPPVANAELQSGTRIFTRDGSLFITTDRPAEAQVFALTGQLIRTLALPAGETRLDPLTDGIYIVRLSDGTVQKVVVRK
ncbi:leucine-rich repeat domain-containing protein [Parabacteroides gordonii]|uniref:leucine-rich repeat domain-containing protein n=1 Tax=Parabacteroides gordonii TaxID=574930 RepID=UPI0026E9C4E2|nr:leucine-rich repeat domain-containing protein [Parabacteroides gordonii]